MHQYMGLIDEISLYGQTREDRTGVGTRSIFGHQMKFNLSEGFPLLTLKNTHWKSIVYELVWMLRGDTNVKFLNDNGVRIWDEWADERGNLGPVYGKQWRSWDAFHRVAPGRYDWGHIDQIKGVIEQIKHNPWSRRHVVSAWNPADLPDMALAPCHTLFQFYVRADEKGNAKYLDCQLYQRSGDVFLGVPFNIASYALLTHIIAHLTGLSPGTFIHTLGDAHLYLNHMPQVKELKYRWEAVIHADLPQVLIDGDLSDIDDLAPEHIYLHGYDPLPTIRAEVAV